MKGWRMWKYFSNFLRRDEGKREKVIKYVRGREGKSLQSGISSAKVKVCGGR